MSLNYKEHLCSFQLRKMSVGIFIQNQPCQSGINYKHIKFTFHYLLSSRTFVITGRKFFR